MNRQTAGMEEIPPSPLLMQYLADVEEGLDRLPLMEQRAELLELRTHLMAIVRAEEELGCSSDDAVTRALKQFGSASEVTTEIVRIWEESRRTPVRQLFGALCVSVVGVAAAYFTAKSLAWVGAPAPGGRASYVGFSQLIWTLFPIVLGTVVGKVFPRALHARIPIVVAALLWPLWSLVELFPSGWLEQVIQGTTAPSTLLSQILKHMNPCAPVYVGSQILTFLMTAWVAQSAARRPSGEKRFIAWCKDLLRRLPDTWIGGITLCSLVVAVVGVLPGFFLASNHLILSPIYLIIDTAIGIVAGAAIGYLLPRRGWIGVVLQTSAMLMVVLYLLWKTPTLLANEITGFWLLTYILPLMIPITAHGVGRKRLATR